MWYSVSVLYEGVHDDGPPEENLWEESILLIEADIEDEAKELARKLAVAHEHSYETAAGGMLHWKFRQIECVYELLHGKPEHQAEIFSRFLRASEVASLLTPFDD